MGRLIPVFYIGERENLMRRKVQRLSTEYDPRNLLQKSKFLYKRLSWKSRTNFRSQNILICRPQWPRGLRRRSAAARLLRSWIRIPPGTWMFVCCECCELSGRGLCDELITRPHESYRLWCVVVCDLENLVNEEAMIRVGLQRQRKKYKEINHKYMSTLWNIYIYILQIQNYKHREDTKLCHCVLHDWHVTNMHLTL